MGPHRADVRLPRGLVIEFQNSAISPDDIREREEFYKNMLWVFNGNEFADNINFRELENPRWDYEGRRYDRTFRWLHPRPTHRVCQRPIYWDFGDDRLFRVMWIAPRNEMVGGYGTFRTREWLLMKCGVKP